MKLNSAQCRSSAKNSATWGFPSRTGFPSCPPQQQHSSLASTGNVFIRSGALFPSLSSLPEEEQAASPLLGANSCLRIPASPCPGSAPGNRKKLALCRQSSLKQGRREIGYGEGGAPVLRRSLSCTTIGRKRVLGLEGECCGDISLQFSPSTKRIRNPASLSSISEPSTPTTSCPSEFGEIAFDSSLEALPFDVLVRIVCCLQHDELQPVFHVSRRLRKAVSIARHFHFDFTTPERKKRNGKVVISSDTEEDGGLVEGRREEEETEVAGAVEVPPTPNAPRHGPKPREARISPSGLWPFAPPLFHDCSPNAEQGNGEEDDDGFGSASMSLLHKKHPRPLSKRGGARKKRVRMGVAFSHRVLFSEEDELCHAVTQHSI